MNLLRFTAGPVSVAVAVAASIYLIGPYSPALCVLAIAAVFWATALLRGLAVVTVCAAAFFLGAWDAGRRAWKWFNEAPPAPQPRKAFDRAGIPVADWDRFCGEITRIQHEMVRAASRWEQR